MKSTVVLEDAKTLISRIFSEIKIIVENEKNSVSQILREIRAEHGS